MSAAERVFAVMLKAYPPEFRAAYDREMMVVFRDYHRERGANVVRFWSEIVWDVAKSAPALRLEVLRARTRHGQEGVFGTIAMATLAILIGTLEVVNSGVEGWFGVIVNGDAISLLAATLGIIGGALLFTSGIALLRSSARAATLVRRTALGCFGVFVLTAIALPRLSIFATMLGTAFPIALLVFMRMSRGKAELKLR